jgi:hypothetical protein
VAQDDGLDDKLETENTAMQQPAGCDVEEDPATATVLR